MITKPVIFFFISEVKNLLTQYACRLALTDVTFRLLFFFCTCQVSDNDRNVVEFYGGQAETYSVYLSNAIDAFILTIEHSQPPKVFVAYSKFVILNAHKLLCIGDTVHRNVDNVKLKETVLERSNQLCQVIIS